MIKQRERVRLHLYNAPSIEGLLLSRRRGYYKLHAACTVEGEGQTVGMDGVTLVPKRVVFAVQVLPE